MSKKSGRTVGRPRLESEPLDETVVAAISKTDFDKLCEEAAQRNKSLSSLVRMFLKASLKHRGPKTNGNGP